MIGGPERGETDADGHIRHGTEHHRADPQAAT